MKLNSTQTKSSPSPRAALPVVWAGIMVSALGCQTPWTPIGSLAGSSPPTPTPLVGDEGAVRQAGGSFIDGTNRLVGFISGTSQDEERAKEFYQAGDKLFREAREAPEESRAGLFARAANKFKQAGDAAPGSGLEQDALFMRGEAQFFADDLSGARDTFETLQKDFPRNRHSDRVAARLFKISRYWIDTAKAGGDRWYRFNLFDKKRPAYDAGGHAVKVLDQIRYDDPTGKLADDATLAAAIEHIRNERFEEADEFLTDLRETFSDSDHMFLAHMLGIQCKLKVYAGPRYSERALEEASELVKQTRRRFPKEIQEKKYSEMLARSAAEIEFHQAANLEERAKYREKRHEFGAAREEYRRLLAKYPNTPQAERARKILDKIEGRPAVPTSPLAFMTKVFPDSRQNTPLELTSDKAQTSGGSETPTPPSESIYR
ncbi:MAG: tetratricopeptide repeat protein [Planctomycetota bacterium]